MVRLQIGQWGARRTGGEARLRACMAPPRIGLSAEALLVRPAERRQRLRGKREGENLSRLLRLGLVVVAESTGGQNAGEDEADEGGDESIVDQTIPHEKPPSRAAHETSAMPTAKAIRPSRCRTMPTPRADADMPTMPTSSTTWNG